jgi:hypothetical protein
MNGKLVGLVLVLSAAIAGGALYYLQVYGFYEPVAARGDDVQLVALDTDLPEPIIYENFQAIDAESSPIRYRACFTTAASIEQLAETHVTLDNVTPRNAPEWFECFDAAAIAAELKAGTAQAFLSQKNIHYGVDRIVVITTDGRGYTWHELNDCGEKAYDGTVVGEECPPLPQSGPETN